MQKSYPKLNDVNMNNSYRNDSVVDNLVVEAIISQIPNWMSSVYTSFLSSTDQQASVDYSSLTLGSQEKQANSHLLKESPEGLQ